MAVPVRVRTPVDSFQEPEISVVSEKARTSSEETKVPPEMETVADSRLVSSTSASVREASMTVAPWPSVKERVPEAPEMVGASLTALTVMETVSVSVFVPPEPVEPRSEVVMERVSVPLKLLSPR